MYIQRKKNTKYISFSDRNNKLLLVITSLGFFIFLFKILFSYIDNIFTSYYLSNNFLGIKNIYLGAEHFILSSYLSSLTIILYYAIKYCLSEFFNFATYKQYKIKKLFSENSEKNYKLLLGIIQFHLIISICFTLLMLFIFELPLISAIFTFLSILIVIAIYFKKICSYIKMTFEIFFTENYVKSTVIVMWFVFGFIFLYSFLIIGTKSNSTLELNFSKNNNCSLNISFIQKVPEALSITIINANSKSTNIKIPYDEYQKFTAESISIIKNPDSTVPLLSNFLTRNTSLKSSKKINFQQQEVQYIKDIDLTPYLSNGLNFIVLEFEIQKGIGSYKKHKIINNIYINHDEITFTREQIKINL